MADGVCSCPEPVRGTLPDEFLKHVQKEELEKIKEWLSNGGDVNAATEGGQTLLSASCVYQSNDVLQMLLQYPKLHLNTKHRLGTLSRFTPLCIASSKGLAEMVISLLGCTDGECCLDVGATTSKGKSALTLAAEKGHWEVVEALCQGLSIPEDDNALVTNLARWAKQSNIIQLLKREQSRKTSGSTPAYERVYENSTNPRGLVLILNYSFKDNTKYHRKGSEADAKKLDQLFKGMEYETEEHCDLSKSETLSLLQGISKTDRLKDISSFVVVILSHGKNRATFWSNDLEKITMDELCGYFSDNKCPNLKNKPKIFLLQFCRGKDMANQVSVSRGPSSDAVKDAFTDMVWLFAAQEGFESYRFEGKIIDPFTGTPFIEAFCQVLRHKSHLWLDDIQREVTEEYGNTPWGQPLDCQYLAFKKKFCFNSPR